MINNLGKYAHPPKGGGRNPNAGRHNAGANPAPGSGTAPVRKAGQAEPAGNKPTTAQPGFGKPKLPMVNPTNSSAQAASQVSAQPAPFKVPMGLGQKSVALNGSVQNNALAGKVGASAPKNPNAVAVGGMKPKTLGMTVGVKNNPPKIHGALTKSAKKGGHSLLYGD